MAVLGRVTPGLRAAIFGSFQVLMVVAKIPPRTSASSFRLFTPLRLYDTVMGAATVGKYRTVPPLKVDSVPGAMALSEPAHWTTWPARSVLPLPEPPPP